MKNKKLVKKVTKHLKGDIKGYKKEAAEDRDLIKTLKGKKHEKKESKSHEKKEEKSEKKIKKVMKEFSKDKLHSGSKKGPLVKDKKQALAIGYAESRKKNKSKKK